MSIESARQGWNRRSFLRAAFLAGAAGIISPVMAGESVVTMPFANGERRLVKFPQKRELLLVTM